LMTSMSQKGRTLWSCLFLGIVNFFFTKMMYATALKCTNSAENMWSDHKGLINSF